MGYSWKAVQVCPVCGREFQPPIKGRRRPTYCSTNCRVAAYRRRARLPALRRQLAALQAEIAAIEAAVAVRAGGARRVGDGVSKSMVCPFCSSLMVYHEKGSYWLCSTPGCRGFLCQRIMFGDSDGSSRLA